MRNQTRFQQNQVKTQTQCKNIDFRNAKFQGRVISSNSTYKYTFTGFGCAIDYNYTWVCAQWLNNLMSGTIAAIFPDSSKIYGYLLSQYDIHNSSNPSLTVCQGQFYKIYLKSNILVIDLHTYGENQYNILAKFIIHTLSEQEKEGQIEQRSRRGNLKESPNYKKVNRFNKKLQYICQKQYLVDCKSSAQINMQKSYMKILGQLLKQKQLDVNKINLQLFLKNHQPFCQNIQVTHSTHEKINHNKKQTQKFLTLSCKYRQQFSSNLLLKLFQKQYNTLLQLHKCTQKYELLKICSIDTNQNQQIIKRYQYYPNNQGYIVEQCVFKNDNEVVGYAEYEYLYSFNKKNTMADNFYLYTKPNWLKPNHQLHWRCDSGTGKQCIKNLTQHYKKSLNYCNQYIDIKPIYTLEQYFIQLLRLALPTIQIQFIKSKQDQKGEKSRQNTYAAQMEDYSRISFNGQGNIGRSMLVNGSKIGEYVINNQVQAGQYQASIDDVRREIVLIELRGSRKKSRINTQPPADNRQKQQHNLMHMNVKKQQQEIIQLEQKQNILVDEDEQQNDWGQISTKRGKNQNRWNKNVQKQRNIQGDSSRRLQKQDMSVRGSYIYYFDEETNSNPNKQIKTNRNNPNTPIYKLNLPQYADPYIQYNSESFNGNMRPNTNYTTNYTNSTNNQNIKQLQQLALYYQNIELQAAHKKNNSQSKSKSKTKDKKTKKDKDTKKSKSKGKNIYIYNKVDKYESPPQSIPVKIGKQTPHRRQQPSNRKKQKQKKVGGDSVGRKFGNQIAFDEEPIYKHPRQYQAQTFQLQQEPFNINTNINTTQKKQASKIGKFFKYTPQNVKNKAKSSYILGK